MSFRSNRACYKCGNLGHLAEACSNAERLCYNCKRPGHNANACPHPRTSEGKQCYFCHGHGHIQADCPTLRTNPSLNNDVCFNCGQSGHRARHCPKPPNLRRNVKRPASTWNHSSSGTCFKCGGPNHLARDCQADALKCYSCGKFGHISKDCDAPNGGPLHIAGKTCYQCGEPGHIAKNCKKSETGVPGELGTVADIAASQATAIDREAQAAPIAPVA